MSQDKAADRVRRTRAEVFFESNNRLFSLAKPIRDAFPGARFIFLHRDGRDVVRSGMDRGWYQPGDPFRRIDPHPDAPPFEKVCHWWRAINQRIRRDLEDLPHMVLRFDDLVAGDAIPDLASFLGRDLPIERLPPVNVQRQRTFPPYEEWTERHVEAFWRICGPEMDTLGYPVPEPVRSVVASARERRQRDLRD